MPCFHLRVKARTSMGVIVSPGEWPAGLGSVFIRYTDADLIPQRQDKRKAGSASATKELVHRKLGVFGLLDLEPLLHQAKCTSTGSDFLPPNIVPFCTLPHLAPARSKIARSIGELVHHRHARSRMRELTLSTITATTPDDIHH